MHRDVLGQIAQDISGRTATVIRFLVDKSMSLLDNYIKLVKISQKYRTYMKVSLLLYHNKF